MKKMLKTVFIILLLVVSILPIYAEGTPTIVYSGSSGEISSNGDFLYVDFHNVLPGDHIEQDIHIVLKDIEQDTKVYLEILHDGKQLPESITFDIYKDGNLIQSGINSSYEQCLICDTNKDETVEFKLVLNVPTTIGNEIKGFKKEHIWSIVVEDSFGNKHAVDNGGKRHAVDTGIDYEAYRTNMTLFLLSIGMIVVIISYRLLIKHKES